MIKSIDLYCPNCGGKLEIYDKIERFMANRSESLNTNQITSKKTPAKTKSTLKPPKLIRANQYSCPHCKMLLKRALAVAFWKNLSKQ